MNNETALVPQAQVNEIVSQFGTMSGFDLLQRQAKMVASSSLVPEQFSFFDKNGKLKDLVGQNYALANAVIALELSQRIAASPLMVAQNIVVIYGRPSWSSQFVIAAINACGRFSPLRFKVSEPEREKEFSYTYTEGYGQNKQTKVGKVSIANRTCMAWAYDKKTGEVLEGPEVSIEMAVKEGWYTKSGSKWVTMPDLMLRYRAAAFFGRLYAPDLLMGMRSVDEAIDIGRDVIDVEPEPSGKIVDLNEEIKATKAGKNEKPTQVAPPAEQAKVQSQPSQQEEPPPPEEPPDVVAPKQKPTDVEREIKTIDRLPSSLAVDKWRLNNHKRIEALGEEKSKVVMAHAAFVYEALKSEEEQNGVSEQ